MATQIRCQQCQKKFASERPDVLCPQCAGELTIAPTIYWRPVMAAGIVSIVVVSALTMGAAYHQRVDVVPIVNETTESPLEAPAVQAPLAANGQPQAPAAVEPPWPAIPILGSKPVPSFQKWLGAQWLYAVRQIKSPKKVLPQLAVVDPPAQAPEDPPDVADIGVKRIAKEPIKRRRQVADEDLRRQIASVTEVSISDIPIQARQVLHRSVKHRPNEIPELAFLPMKLGIDAQIGHEAANTLQAYSRKLRETLAKAHGGAADPRLNYETFARQMTDKRWGDAESVPTLEHVLMSEEKAARLLLVDKLSAIRTREATAALARRALFDLSSEVRDEAAHALKGREIRDYRPILMAGFRHPWAAVAEHAAETLIHVGDKESASEMVAMLREPDPNKPVLKKATDRLPYVRELVRINHHQNCILCHSPSTHQRDPLRTAAPSRAYQLDPIQALQYSPNGGNGSNSYIRADVTYLRSEFATYQPVEKPGPWPVHQRFDYVVRERLMTQAEIQFTTQTVIQNGIQVVQVVPIGAHDGESRHDQRDSILFALRELTQLDAGVSTKGWEDLKREGRIR